MMFEREYIGVIDWREFIASGIPDDPWIRARSCKGTSQLFVLLVSGRTFCWLVS